MPRRVPDQGVAGSNPVAPTKHMHKTKASGKSSGAFVACGQLSDFAARRLRPEEPDPAWPVAVWQRRGEEAIAWIEENLERSLVQVRAFSPAGSADGTDRP